MRLGGLGLGEGVEGVQRREEEGDQRRALGFDRHRDGVEPGLVKRAGEGVQGVEGGGRGEGVGGAGGAEVPEVEAGVGRDRGDAVVLRDGEEGDGESGWEDLGMW